MLPRYYVYHVDRGGCYVVIDRETGDNVAFTNRKVPLTFAVEADAQQWADSLLRDEEPAIACDRHRPDDATSPGRCMDCGQKITWVGPESYTWEVVPD